MVQKEVAQRIVAPPGNKQYGSLTVFVNFYSDPEVLLIVPKTVFMPQPKVDSAVIKLTIKEAATDVDRKLFFRIVKAAFSQRRKTIVNSLSNKELGLDKEQVRELLEKSNISPKARAEDLKIEDFIKICQTIPSLDI